MNRCSFARLSSAVAGGLRRVKLQPRMHPERDILADGKMMKEIVFLKQHLIPAPGWRRRGMRLAVNQNRAAHRRQKAGDQIELAMLLPAPLRPSTARRSPCSTESVRSASADAGKSRSHHSVFNITSRKFSITVKSKSTAAVAAGQ